REVLAQAVQRLKARPSDQRPEDALAEVLSGDLGFNGDLLSYEQPGNADLISVAERRTGLPVVLGVFYIAAARKAGITAAGVDFPGHFLLRVETADGPVALDPFSHGRLVLPSELTARALQTG